MNGEALAFVSSRWPMPGHGREPADRPVGEFIGLAVVLVSGDARISQACVQLPGSEARTAAGATASVDLLWQAVADTCRRDRPADRWARAPLPAPPRSAA